VVSRPGLRQPSRAAAEVAGGGYHLTVDLTDKAIEFIQDAKAIAPDKPFFLYYCPGAAHAPHHAPKEWADKYKGRFDMGYEAYRELVFERQKQLGIVPDGAELSPINPYAETTSHDGKSWSELDRVRPWDSLSDEEKRLFSRMAEVYGGFLSHADHELGRLLDHLEESGQLDNTIIVLVSDNGASGEGGPNGSVNENKFFNGIPDTIEENLKYLDELGGTRTYNHYPTGWAWAFNTPFKMWKRYSNYEGGTADPLIVSWPQGIEPAGEFRRQYCHAVDIVPTLLDALGVELPDGVNGYPQKPLEGVSFLDSFHDADAATRKETQFYSMLGTRAIWHKGWKAATAVPAAPDSWGDFHQQRWELFDTEADPSECRDLAEQHPVKPQELIALWWAEAGRYGALPLESRGAVEILTTERPQLSKPRTRYVYYPGGAEVPESVAPNIRNRSYTIAAEMEIDTPEAGGVIFSQGSRFGGHALYVTDGKLKYVYNWIGELVQVVESDATIPTGHVVLSASFEREAETMPTQGTLGLYIRDEKVGEATIRTQPAKFGLGGGGLVVGRSGAEPVADDYPGDAPWAFVGGTIKRVFIDVSGEPFVDLAREARAAFARQ
jgi:arylsulfatase A-like enzyme